MDLVDTLQQSGALDSITRDLGIDPAVARSGAEALAPAILGGMKKQAVSGGGGLDGLAGMLGANGDNLLDILNNSDPTPEQPGNEVLGQIFGSRDVSRTVAGQASQTTGIDPSILKKMLPLLAMAVTGYLAKQQGGVAPGRGGGLGGMLGQILGGAGGGRRGGMSAGGLGSLIDMDGDGNPLDDILGMATKFGRP